MKKTTIVLSLLVSLGLLSCSTDNISSDQPSQKSSSSHLTAKEGISPEDQYKDIVTDFYSGDFTYVKTEQVNDDFDTYTVTTIESKGVERGYIIAPSTDKKAYFVDKNVDSKVLTLIDEEGGQQFEFDMSDNPPVYVTNGFLGFTKKFFGFGQHNLGGAYYHIGVGGPCYQSGYNSVSVLFMEFQNGDALVPIQVPCPPGM